MNWPALLNYATLGLVILGLFWFVRLILMRVHRGGFPRCMKCGYPTQGLPEPRCPECGAALDGPSAVQIKPFAAWLWLLAAAAWGVLCLEIALQAPRVIDEWCWQSAGRADIGAPLSAPHQGPPLGLYAEVRGWRVAGWRQETVTVELVCPAQPGKDPATIKQGLGAGDILRLWPEPNWSAPSAETAIAQWYRDHGGSLTTDEATALWRLASDSTQAAVTAGDVSFGHEAPLAPPAVRAGATSWISRSSGSWSGGPQAGSGYWISGGAYSASQGSGPVGEVIKIVTAACWCGGAFYSYRTARRRAGGYRADELEAEARGKSNPVLAIILAVVITVLLVLALRSCM